MYKLTTNQMKTLQIEHVLPHFTGTVNRVHTQLYLLPHSNICLVSGLKLSMAKEKEIKFATLQA